MRGALISATGPQEARQINGPEDVRKIGAELTSRSISHKAA